MSSDFNTSFSKRRLADCYLICVFKAFWSRYFQIYREIRKIIDEGKVGEVQVVDASLGHPMFVRFFFIAAIGTISRLFNLDFLFCRIKWSVYIDAN